MKVFKSIGLASVALAALAYQSVAEAQTVLRMNNWLPPQHSQVVGTMKPWADAIREASGGRVDIQMTDASLGAPPRQYDLAVAGIADITFGVAGYTPGRFDLVGAAELPFVGQSGEARSVALWRTFEKHFAQVNEFEGVKLLAIFAHGAGRIMTSKEPIDSIDDMNGKKFRVGGGLIQDINPALGGVNVAAPANEVYEILSAGIVDGTLLPSEAYDSFNLGGVINYETTVPDGLYSSVWFAVMNQDAFDALSPEDQKVVMDHSGEYLARLGGRTFDKTDEAAIATMEKNGVKRIVADEAFTTAIRERTAPITQAWIEKANAKGVDGKAALDMLIAEAKAYKPE
ncbi:TRAP transporter substrate-binding protein [Polymorphum gilvum]|uniref:Trap-type c4-dicarboxylate transport system, periplasmic component n=1 Tax=Polymorphum gilvum (strain LMG 25793 / CGMCC 1.9160 / SL003B-26A1) TaxID=991905 RepID=F2IXH1_POLGS|nr:TRAP transporter substrate-binding protein [Polymorphum gilvum]ADZ71595.1 Trap-type c4-dicarboxylate transport system, periplasmic component [Polymorphum gilvum SL003B-26A1]